MASAAAGYTLGIDASNIRVGGGLTHLQQLLAHADPENQRFSKIAVRGSRNTLESLPDRNWLQKKHEPALDGPLISRTLWQQRVLPALLLGHECHALFSPGGTLPMKLPVPGFVMSQNLLPFEERELARYSPLSFTRYRLKLLKISQTRSMNRAHGIVFLTEYAKRTILPWTNARQVPCEVIPHGIEGRFFLSPRPARPLSEYAFDHPFRLVYVSIIDFYKHQDQVALAAAGLRRNGLPIIVEFVGPFFTSQLLKRFRSLLKRLDPLGQFLIYRPAEPFASIHQTYHQADGFVFASTCENLPIILLEAMASGLPIASSRRGPMPEVLGDAGIYFDPENASDIERALCTLVTDHHQREVWAHKAYLKARAYSWKTCAERTLAFISGCLSGTSSHHESLRLE